MMKIFPGLPSGQNNQNDGLLGYNPRGTYPRPSAPGIDDLPDYNNDIEEEMVRAAIEASKREVGNVYLDQQFGAHDVCKFYCLSGLILYTSSALCVRCVNVGLEQSSYSAKAISPRGS